MLSGAATEPQLRSHLAAASLRLGDSDRTRLATLAEGPDDYWSRRSQLAWR